MDVKEVIAVAKEYIATILSEESVSNLGIEEVEYVPDRHWSITVGFSRPWQLRPRPPGLLENLYTTPPARRSYKALTIADDGTVQSMKDRQRESMSD